MARLFVPSDENRIAEMAEDVSYEAFMLSGTLQLIDQDFPPAEKVHETVRTVVRNALFRILAHPCPWSVEDFLHPCCALPAGRCHSNGFLALAGSPRRCLSTNSRLRQQTHHAPNDRARREGPAPWQAREEPGGFPKISASWKTLRSTDPQKADWLIPGLNWRRGPIPDPTLPQFAG